MSYLNVAEVETALQLAAGPANAATLTATAPMMLDWIVKKLKKFTRLAPTSS